MTRFLLFCLLYIVAFLLGFERRAKFDEYMMRKPHMQARLRVFAQECLLYDPESVPEEERDELLPPSTTDALAFNAALAMRAVDERQKELDADLAARDEEETAAEEGEQEYIPAGGDEGYEEGVEGVEGVEGAEAVETGYDETEAPPAYPEPDVETSFEGAVHRGEPAEPSVLEIEEVPHPGSAQAFTAGGDGVDDVDDVVDPAAAALEGFEGALPVRDDAAGAETGYPGAEQVQAGGRPTDADLTALAEQMLESTPGSETVGEGDEIAGSVEIDPAMSALQEFSDDIPVAPVDSSDQAAVPAVEPSGTAYAAYPGSGGSGEPDPGSVTGSGGGVADAGEADAPAAGGKGRGRGPGSAGGVSKRVLARQRAARREEEAHDTGEASDDDRDVMNLGPGVSFTPAKARRRPSS